MKLLALLLALFAVSVYGSVELKEIKISEKDGNVDVLPFKYTVNGKAVTCKGAAFAIAPTKAKPVSMTFSLKAMRHRPVWVYMPNKLPGRNITDFKLYKGDTLLKEGTDYILDKQGALCHPDKKMKPFKVKAEFSFLPERYDSIVLDPKQNALKLIKGNERNKDAEEYIPELPAGSIRLFNVVATGDRVTVLPLFGKQDYVQKGALDSLEKKLVKGNKIKLLGYGDSITAIQNGRPGYEANGRERDRLRRYFYRYPKDTLKKIELFDFKDGIGKKHSKMGWNWALKQTLEDKYGVEVEYLNCGIGGTRSDVTKDQGLYPERIAKALELKPDLVVLAFGMNEISSNRTEKNITEIINKFKAVGSDVIIMGVPQINGTRPERLQKAWERTNATLAKVAKAQNCPFVDTRKVNLGLKSSHICSGNLYNHPGIYELILYGNALAKVLK